MPTWDAVWINAQLATMAPDGPFGLIERGAVAAKDGRIAWIGPAAALPGAPAALARAVHDVGGKTMTPGLVDAHTHLVYHGSGVTDFEILSQGGGRKEMLQAGGGVPGMVRRTRAASDETIYEDSARRAGQLIAHGVTTFESKSGAGLELAHELRTMRISRELGRRFPVTVKSTFLGAHAVGPEYAGRTDDYTDYLCDTVLPAAVREDLVDAVDGFCDPMGFSHAQITRLFEKAQSFGLPVKLHAEQYRDFSAADIVARFKGLSADHVEYVSEPTVRAMAGAGTVATLLPGANWTLREKQRPPLQWFRQYGVDMAIATNCNPVSSPTTSPLMMMNMACVMFGLTTEEAVAGFTRNGAKALGLAATHGTLAPGKMADLVIWDVPRPNELPYRIAANPCAQVIKEGQIVYTAVEPRFQPLRRYPANA